MVDLVLLQSVSYVAGAIGVCVAAFYYALNLRETTRNRRAGLTQSMLQIFSSYEGFKRILQLYDMKWESFDDFMKKYDSTVNPDNAAIRHEIWDACDVLGHMWREGIIDKNMIYNRARAHISMLWIKFKPIIEEYRRSELPIDIWSNWEYLAKELDMITLKNDAMWADKQTRSIIKYQK